MSEVDPSTRLWDLMRGVMTTKAFAIAADLKLADLLASGPRPVRELAQKTGADEQTLYRILRALASDGVFEEHEPGVFGNTEASELLRAEQTTSWPEFAHLFGSVFYDAIATMDPNTRAETFRAKFGSDYWSWLGQHPDERATFDAAMAGGKEGGDTPLVELDWRDDETVVDIGGGNGALLKALLERRPQLRGIVFDLPETNRDESTFGDRLTFVAGDFFKEVPAGDAYVLSGILHDWDDVRATEILRTIRAAGRPGARLLVTENVIPPGNDPHGGKWLDLLMLVIGGRERNEADWRALLEGAGFEVDKLEDGLIQARCR
jgi:O-methyltransferase domain/Dimerisation domain